MKRDEAKDLVTKGLKQLNDALARGRSETLMRYLEVMARFHHIVESSRVGVRKPELSFYEQACTLAGVGPHEVVFLDDLGINLKPAKAMGMTTIKVLGAEQAIADLERVLGLPLR